MTTLNNQVIRQLCIDFMTDYENKVDAVTMSEKYKALGTLMGSPLHGIAGSEMCQYQIDCMYQRIKRVRKSIEQ